jgi:hypothetical protein
MLTNLFMGSTIPPPRPFLFSSAGPEPTRSPRFRSELRTTSSSAFRGLGGRCFVVEISRAPRCAVSRALTLFFARFVAGT